MTENPMANGKHPPLKIIPAKIFFAILLLPACPTQKKQQCGSLKGSTTAKNSGIRS
jgi:hypothetical protein